LQRNSTASSGFWTSWTNVCFFEFAILRNAVPPGASATRADGRSGGNDRR
jgi:hypothetical protein